MIHGIVRSAPFDTQAGLLDFDNLTKNISLEGEDLVDKLGLWLDDYVFETLGIFRIVPNDKKKASRLN